MSDSKIEKHKDKDAPKREFLGDLVGTGEIVGDIVSPIIDLEEIEAYRECES
jgi:hypothetical protein